MKHTLTLNFVPLSVNKLLAMHHMKAHKAKSVDMQAISLEVKSQNIPKATGKRKLKVTCIKNRLKDGKRKGGRLGDPDNVQKVILDGLVKAGVLVDDSAQWLQLEQPVMVAGDCEKTIIEIEDI